MFNALLDNGDEGLYVFSHGSLSLVAKTGTVIPGVGKIAALDFFSLGVPSSFARINNRGQVAFGAALTNGGGALLLATPGGTGNSEVAAVSSALAAPTSADPSQASIAVLPLAPDGVDSLLAGDIFLVGRRRSPEAWQSGSDVHAAPAVSAVGATRILCAGHSTTSAALELKSA